MNTSEIIATIVSLLSLIMSIIAYVKMHKSEKAEKALIRAPILVIEECIFNGNRYDFIDAQKASTDSRTFTIDRRCFKDEKGIEPYYSLLMDASLPQTSEEDKISVVGFDTMQVKNIGYSLISVEIKQIEMMLKGNRNPIVLNPSKNNALRLSITNNSTIKLQLSCKASAQADSPFDMNKLVDEKYCADLATICGSNLINTYCESMADLWTEILIYCNTKNIHNETYSQKIRFFIENNVYYVESYDVEKKRLPNNNSNVS
jgi:hypothetical protein